MGTISGYVIDAKTKEPLAGANVLVAETQIGAATDENGNFVINNAPLGTQLVKAVFIGYQDRVISDVFIGPGDVVNLKIELMPEIFETDDIVVSAGFYNEDELPQPSTLNLTREEIRRFPGGFEDVVRTVSTLPGVAINVSQGRNDLIVRGGGPSENLYTINNIEVQNINHFGTQGTASGSLSFINTDLINNVTFSTGGFSALYGDKMSSVLQLDLNEGRNDRLGGKLLVSATQFGANLEGPLTGDGNFIFSARKSYLDFIFKAAGLPFVPIYTDFNFAGNYRINPANRITVLGLAAFDEVSRNLDSAKNRRVNSTLLDNTQTQLIGGIDFRHLYKNGYFDLTFSANKNTFRFSQQDTNSVRYFKNNSDEKEYNSKITFYYALNKKLGFYGGFAYKNIDTKNEIFFADSIIDRNGNKIAAADIGVSGITNAGISGNKSAAFVKAEWQPSYPLLFDFGLRLDWYSPLKEAQYISPRLAFTYTANPQWKIKLSGGLYHQAPSYIWLVNTENRKLKALQNRMVVLGTSYKPQPEWRASFEVFYKDYRNLPSGTLPGVNDYIVLTNTGSSYGGREDDFQSFGLFTLNSRASGFAYGAELNIQKRYSDKPYYGQASLSWSRTLYTANDGNEYPGQFDQRYIFSIVGGYILNEKWEFSSKFRFFSGAPYTPVYIPDENPIKQGVIQNLPEEYLSKRLDNSYVLDVRVDRNFMFDDYSLIIFVDIQNILNFKVPQKPQYDFGDNKIVDSSDIGILPSIGISFSF